MEINIIAFAVPLFTFLMVLEYLLSLKKQRKNIFQFDEVIANLNTGIAERLCDLFTTGLFFFFFSWIYRHFALFEFQSGIITWILLFLLTDLVWYWYHRVGHQVNLFWSFHVVHHQSDDFNLTVSARITVFQAAARCLFWSVLPLLGFHPELVTTFLLIHGTYPFFTHTQLIGKLGILEYVLVTPSHHRVHHSSNPKYLDKNYGDVLIIWDKIFGTFAKEDEKPVYGLTKPLNSYSFLWQHFHFFLEVMIAFQRATGFKEKIKCLFGKPDSIDPGIRAYLESKLLRKTEPPPKSKVLVKYILIKTIVSLVLLFLTILFEHYLNGPQILVASIYLILSVIATGALLEQRRWIFNLEFARAVLIGIFIWFTYPFFSLPLFLLAMLGIFVFFHRLLGEIYFKYLNYAYAT